MINSIIPLQLLAQGGDFGEIINWQGTTLQWACVWLGFLAFVICLFSVNWIFQFGVIARATSKEAIRQPVFAMLTMAGILVMLVNTWVPFFSMGDDTKIYIDCGLATILISSIVFAVWTSSTAIADEIEGKTAMTLLSKPINRQQFILGKYVGILQTVFWMILILTVTFSLLTFYKIGYDEHEAGKQDLAKAMFQDKVMKIGNTKITISVPSEQHSWVILRTIPSVMLTFMEVAIMAGIGVVISTRLPMVVNMVTCLTIFVVSHLLPIVVQSTESIKELEFVAFIAKLFAVIFPMLDVFNSAPAVATGKIVPPDYMGYAALYCACFCTMLLMLSFLMFEDRDLA